VLAEGWHWVEVHADLGRLELPRYGRARRVARKLSEEDEKRLSELGARYDELVSELNEDEDSPELERIAREIEELQDKKEGWAEEDMAQAGAIVTLGVDGEPEAIRGLLRPGTKSAEEAKPRDSKKTANGYAESILLDLSAHRTAALREVLAGQPDTALTALLHALLGKLFYNRAYASCVSLMVQTADLARSSQTVIESKAELAFQARHKAWTEKLPEAEKSWDWLTELGDDGRHSLLAHCVALTINALDGRLGPAPDAVETLVGATGLDMRKWWKPTEANFLGRLTKTDILAAVSEGVSQQASWRLCDLKKDRMVTEAEKLLADSGWLPQSLRVAPSEPLDAAAE
jgi:ParB family chromosome partitioning protein